jgi:hypothetical protein
MYLQFQPAGTQKVCLEMLAVGEFEEDVPVLRTVAGRLNLQTHILALNYVRF